MARVSIGLPVFNGADHIEQSVRSVLGQTYRDFELLISDNASTDDTVQIVERLAAGDARVTLIRNRRNHGAAWNYNSLFEASTGEFFRWHSHDDWFEPTLLASLVAALDADPDAILAHSWTRFVDAGGTVTREFCDNLGAVGARPRDRLPVVVQRLTYCNVVFGLIRRDTLARTALIASFPGSDAALLYELAVLGRFVVVPDPLFVRRPGASIVANPSIRAVAEWFDPIGRGKRLPGVHLWLACMRAIWQARFSFGERLATTVAFMRVWPISYARKSRRRHVRRKAVE